jgi:hypothetical protein
MTDSLNHRKKYSLVSIVHVHLNAREAKYMHLL